MGDANFIKSLGDHLVLAVMVDFTWFIDFICGIFVLFLGDFKSMKRLTSKLLSFTWAY